ncbi:MAG TPA: dienelactone hydrolase family protein [Pseudolabrys sp.]|nr:dienelactone hydrolase family protein [Pseudolabrys sp.]
MQQPDLIAGAVDIVTPDGRMDGYAARPSGPARCPLVVLFMDIWGLRDELFAIARRIAGHGYYCVVPNLFYREGRIRYERRDPSGRMVSFHTLPVALQEEMRAHVRRLTRATTRTDVAAILDFCRGQPVDDGPAGTVGFCLGGRKAFIAGQEFPERFRATASLHGTWLVSDAEDSPHRLTHLMRGEVYCGYAERDRFAAPELMAALEQAFAAHTQVSYRSRFHRAADHGYALPDRDVYDHAAVEGDWQEIFAMFGRQLARRAG